MRKILALQFLLVTFAIIFAKGTAADTPLCSDYKFLPYPGNLVEGEFNEITFSAKVEALNDTYAILGGGTAPWDRFEARGLKPAKDDPNKGWLPEQTITTGYLLSAGTHSLHIKREGLEDDYCRSFSYTIAPAPTPTPRLFNCRLQAFSDPPNKFDSASIITIKGSGLYPLIKGLTYHLMVRSRDGQVDRSFPITTLVGDSFSLTIDSFNYNTYDVVLKASLGRYIDTSCKTWFKIDPTKGEAPTPIPVCPQTPCKDLLEGPHPDEACRNYIECQQKCTECTVLCPDECRGTGPLANVILCYKPVCQENCLECGAVPKPSAPVPKIEDLCKNAKDFNYNDCIDCVRGTGKYDGRPGIWTAIGCLPTNYSKLISEKIFPIGLGLAGGIAFLYFIYGCFLILTSAGNAEKVQQGKQIIVSSLSGLLFIIFSVFILKVIGVDILRLPGFGPEPK